MAAVPTADLTTPLLLDGREPEVILDVGGDESTAGRGGGEWSENPFEFLGAGFLSLPPPSTIDPFRNHTPYLGGVYEWIKILLCVPVALIRLVLFGLCLLIGFLATKLALYGWKDKQRPMPRWRCGIMWVTRICARCILFSFGYHWIRRIGRPALREIAPIVVSNHVSYIEPIFFFYELFPTIVASESHDAMPFVGTIIRAMQVIYVDRFSAPSRKHAVNEIKRKASCNGFPRVLLFPEGTTTNGRSLLTFQLGAFIPGFPIQPVVVRYPHVHFDQSWGNISLAKLMFRMFAQFHNFMEVEYLPIIVPLEKKQENAVHLSQRTSFSMARALNVVPTSYSYGDMMLVTRASQLKKEKSSAYLVEMAWVESSFNISTSEAMEFLDQFLAMNPDSNGRAKIHGFLSVLRLELSPIAEKIFGFFDMEKKGSITFRQFLLGSAHIMKQPLFRHACDTVFNECDDEGTGYISVQKLGDVIQYTVPGMSDPTLSQLFYLFDIDNDGSISRDDFMACLRRNPPLIALFSSCSMSNNQLEVV